MTVNPTIYPYRQALDIVLRAKFMAVVIPAINTDIASRMTSTDPTKIPNFVDANIITGELTTVGEPTIEIVDAGEDSSYLANQHYKAWFATHIRIKAPYVCDNTPEDFDTFFKICTDNFRDFLNSPSMIQMLPVHPTSGLPLLPEAQQFINCLYTGYRVMSFPNYTGDTKTRCRGRLLTHVAMVDYALQRDNPLGG